MVGICGTVTSGGFGMTTLGGDADRRYSWGWRIGRRIERGWVRVCESVAQGGFAFGGLLLDVQRWIA